MLAPALPNSAGSSSIPFSVYVDKNQVLNRLIMDVFGWGGPGIVMARNRYERIERSLDIGLWLFVGVFIPVLLDKLINRLVGNRWVRKPFNLDKSSQPLAIPFEWTDVTKNLKGLTPDALKKFGLSAEALSKPLLRRIQNLKLLILLIDLALMAAKGQGYYWGKNWLTEKLSRQKGFSGEFNYVNKAFLDKKAEEYEASKHKRVLASLAIGYGAVMALPLLLTVLLRYPAESSKSIVGKLKQLIPAFNYQDTIFMSRWVVLWHTFFNWNIPSLLSARDNHEFRENLARTSTVYVFYAVGDRILSGFLARFVQKRLDVPILAKETWAFKLPLMMPLEELFLKYGKHSKAYKVGLANFWFGIVGACAALNTVIPLLNNYYTHQKVMQEQNNLSDLIGTRHHGLLKPATSAFLPFESALIAA